MSQLEDTLVDVLVARCEADEATTYVDALLAEAEAAITGGKGTVGSLTSASLNGKNFNRSIQLSPLEVASACRRALAIYNETETEVSATYADYRCIRH